MQHRLSYSGLWLLLLLMAASSWSVVTRAPKHKPYLVKNDINLLGGNFNKNERAGLVQRLYAQLDDSAKVPEKDILFLLTVIRKPPVFDTGYAGISARNMRASMLHLGYYSCLLYTSPSPRD